MKWIGPLKVLADLVKCLLSINLMKILGTIYAQKQLDYEKKTQHALVVAASDKGQPQKVGKTTVTININDVNDNIPYFNSFPMTVAENETIGSIVSSLKAQDEDSGLNAETEFQLLSKNVPFSVTSNGDIKVGGIIDREIKDFYRLTIKVKDKGTPTLSSEKDIHITVKDINDNNPMFANDTTNCLVEENSVVGTYVCDVSATDKDIGKNGEITYYSSSTDFTVDPVSKFLSVFCLFVCLFVCFFVKSMDLRNRLQITHLKQI